MHVRSTKVLLELDEGLLSLVDAEAVGRTRLTTLRTLLVEALEARARDRGEELPRIEPWTAGVDYGVYLGPCVGAELIKFSEVAHTDRADLITDAEIVVSSLPGKDVISVSLNEGNETVIRSRPVRTAHESVAGFQSVTGYTLPQHVTAGDAQTPSEERIERLKK